MQMYGRLTELVIYETCITGNEILFRVKKSMLQNSLECIIAAI